MSTREMKDSGIEWIGQIPKEWEKIFLKRHFKFEKGKRAALYTKEYIGANKGLYPVYSGQTENEGIMGFVDSYDYELDKCLFSTTVGAKVMTLRLLSGRFCLSQNCLIMQRVSNNDLNFIYYALQSLFDYEKSMIPSYMQPSLRIEDLQKYSIFIPLNISEQQRIATFLDEKCKDIDTLITLQEEMIAELQAYKQSVISEAVTKGLNPNVPMKDSGVEWIGKIPKGWDKRKFKTIFTIKKEIANSLGLDVLSVTQKGIKVKDLTKNEGQLALDYSKYQIVNPNDFVMNHMDLLTGYIDISNQRGVTSPDYRVFLKKEDVEIHLKFYLYIFQYCYHNRIFYQLGQGVSNFGRWRLPAEQLKIFALPFPPLHKQQAIADYLDTKCSQIDELIAIKQQKITELQDYKKSLIYEYVTGKKEVPANN